MHRPQVRSHACSRRVAGTARPTELSTALDKLVGRPMLIFRDGRGPESARLHVSSMRCCRMPPTRSHAAQARRQQRAPPDPRRAWQALVPQDAFREVAGATTRQRGRADRPSHRYLWQAGERSGIVQVRPYREGRRLCDPMPSTSSSPAAASMNLPEAGTGAEPCSRPGAVGEPRDMVAHREPSAPYGPRLRPCAASFATNALRVADVLYFRRVGSASLRALCRRTRPACRWGHDFLAGGGRTKQGRFGPHVWRMPLIGASYVSFGGLADGCRAPLREVDAALRTPERYDRMGCPSRGWHPGLVLSIRSTLLRWDCSGSPGGRPQLNDRLSMICFETSTTSTTRVVVPTSCSRKHGMWLCATCLSRSTTIGPDRLAFGARARAQDVWQGPFVAVYRAWGVDGAGATPMTGRDRRL